jgi:hypothetical protein
MNVKAGIHFSLPEAEPTRAPKRLPALLKTHLT